MQAALSFGDFCCCRLLAFVFSLFIWVIRLHILWFSTLVLVWGRLFLGVPHIFYIATRKATFLSLNTLDLSAGNNKKQPTSNAATL